MNIQEAKTGTRVVRSKGDYVVGRTGAVIEIDEIKNRARVDWDEAPRTWVSFTALELESIPYSISKYEYNNRTGKHSYPKYSRI